MNKELKRVSIVVLLMFVALFTSGSIIQVVQADSLSADDRNRRTLLESYSVERGPILVDGEPIAQSVPFDDQYRFQREYLNPELYAPVTGYLTLGQGNTGLEGSLNEVLSGNSNAQFLEEIDAIITGKDPKGASVELTIDPVVQQAAWDALGDYQGAVVALRPSDGAVLGMVSKPTYDPNRMAVHDTDQVLATYDELLNSPLEPFINRAMNGSLDPPGSTFKLVTASAALESGMSPDDAFPNPAQLTLPQSSSVVQNSDGQTCGPGEEATIATAVRLSCNVPIAELARELGANTLAQQAEKFGFNESVQIPLRSTASVYPRGIDSDARTMLSGFGQDEVRASPLQMAMVSAAIANDGRLMQPNLVESIVGSNLEPIEEFQPTEFSRPISEQTASTMTDIMVSAVSNGVAGNARIAGVDVAGKTGTAENGADDPYTLWFTGFAPAEDPEVVVAVVVQDGGGLGQSGMSNAIAAPIGKAVLEAVLNR